MLDSVTLEDAVETCMPYGVSGHERQIKYQNIKLNLIAAKAVAFADIEPGSMPQAMGLIYQYIQRELERTVVVNALREIMTEEKANALVNQAASMVNAAMIKGGIDLNAQKMDWNVRKEGNGVQMNVDSAMIERFKRDGIDTLRPVIFRMTPIENVWAVVGIKP